MRASPLLLLAAALAAADPEADLRAAHAARSGLEAEERGWALERDRTRAAIDALAAQAAEDTEVAKALTARIAEAQGAEAKATAPLRERLAPLERQAAAALAALRRRVFPGTVPDEGNAADALEAAERADAQVAASIERVRIDGRELSVRILRAGLRHGWWLALDGRGGGTVAVADGALVCTPLADPAPVRALFAQFDGREPPRWIVVGAP